MIMNLIIYSVTALMLLFVISWIFFPASRDWFERPKHRFLNDQKQFDQKDKTK